MAAPIRSAVEEAITGASAKIDASFAKVSQQQKLDTIRNAKENAQLATKEAKLKITPEDEIVDVPRDVISAQANYQELLVKRSEKKRELALKVNRLKKEQELTNVISQRGDRSVYDTMRDMIGKRAGAGNTHSNVEARTTAIYTRVSADIHDLKDQLRTKWAGFSQDTELGNEVVRYLKDGTVKNQEMLSTAAKLADQWKMSANKLKALRNKAGGKVGQLEDWIMPQAHNKTKMLSMGKDEWKAFIRPLLDIERVEKQTGGKIDDVLDNSYDNITRREESNPSFSSVVAKRHEEQRVLHFKDGDSMISYNEMSGNTDVFGIMDNHIRSHSQEVAAMQLFGANPDDNFNRLLDIARADGMGDFQEGKLRSLWDLSLGNVDGDNIVNKADRVIATVGGGHRTIQVASKLGSAAVSAIADLGNIFLGGGYRGLNSFKIFGTGLETLMQEAIGGVKSGRNVEFASRLGLVSEFASASLANSRFAEVTQTGGVAKAAEGVIRASGLGAWTDSFRASFGLELNGKLYQDFGKTFDDLDYKQMLEEYGIGAADWDKIRATRGKTLNSESFSADFLDMEKVYEADEALGYRLSEMFNTEMDAFVIMPTNRTRVWTTWGAKKGTVKGETARNIMLFKSFPIAVVQMHIARWSKMTGSGKVAYTAGAAASSLITGGMALMAYDTVTGKTPRSTDRPEFVWEATVKGGGLGIFSDLFSMAENRYGHSWLGTMVGVPYGTGEDITKTLGDIKKEVSGDDVNVMANAYNRAKKYIPGQNLWYTRTLFSETLGDFMQEAIDPNYYKKESRKQKYMKQREQESYFD
jgi:hypothetical protein